MRWKLQYEGKCQWIPTKDHPISDLPTLINIITRLLKLSAPPSHLNFIFDTPDPKDQPKLLDSPTFESIKHCKNLKFIASPPQPVEEDAEDDREERKQERGREVYFVCSKCEKALREGPRYRCTGTLDSELCQSCFESQYEKKQQESLFIERRADWQSFDFGPLFEALLHPEFDGRDHQYARLKLTNGDIINGSSNYKERLDGVMKYYCQRVQSRTPDWLHSFQDRERKRKDKSRMS